MLPIFIDVCACVASVVFFYILFTTPVAAIAVCAEWHLEFKKMATIYGRSEWSRPSGAAHKCVYHYRVSVSGCHAHIWRDSLSIPWEKYYFGVVSVPITSIQLTKATEHAIVLAPTGEILYTLSPYDYERLAADIANEMKAEKGDRSIY